MLQFIVDTPPVKDTVVSVSSFGTVMMYLVMSLITLGVLGILIHRFIRALQRPELYGTSREQIAKMWTELEQTSGQGIMGAKLAIIEADKLLDRALRSLYMPGETLGERLKSAAYKYPNIRRVWGAHRLRNQLVHDTTFEISSRQAQQALDDYHAALKVLNVM